MGSKHKIQAKAGRGGKSKAKEHVKQPQTQRRAPRSSPKTSGGKRFSDAALFKAVVEHSHDAILFMDAERTIIYASPSIAQISGYEAEELIGKNAVDFSHPDDQEATTRKLLDLLHYPGNTTSIEYRIKHKNGSWVWLDTTATNFLDHPQVQAVVLNLRDITERKRSESELTHFAQNTSTLYELSQQIHTGLDLDQVYENTHQAVQKLMVCDAFVIALLDETTQKIDDVYLWDTDQRWPSGHHPTGQGFTDYIISLGKPLRVNEWDESHAKMTRAGTFGDPKYDTKSVLAVPLFQTNGRSFGMMSAQAHIHNAYTVEHEQLLVTLANQVSKAIENAQIFHKLQDELIERKKAEAAVRKSEALYRQAIEVAGAVPYYESYDDEGRFIQYEFIGEGIRKITGYGPEEFTAALWDSLVLDIHLVEDLAGYSLDEAIQRVRAGDNPIWKCEYRIRAREGKIRWVFEAAVELREEDGVSHGSIGMYQDITERKQAEDRLREGEERFRSLSQAAFEGILIHDRGKILNANQKMVDLFGFHSPDELIGKNGLEILPITEQSREYIRSSMKKNSSEAGEIEVIRKDGSTFPAETQGREITFMGRSARVVAMRDITERKQAEEKVQKQLQRLNALHSIDTAINSSADMQITLEVLLIQLISQLNVDAADVMVFNQPAQMLEYVAGRGFLSNINTQSQLRLSESLAGRVILERRTIHVSNMMETGRNLRQILLLTNDAFREYFAVPLIAKGQIKGVLEVFLRSALEPDDDWMNFLEVLAGQAAIAIDNSQLLQGLQRSNMDIVHAYDATIEGWSRAMDLRDKETEGHTQRVTEMALKLAQSMGINEKELVHIRRGGLLHDIGKLGVPDSILLKPGPLTEEELAIMYQHPTFAANMLLQISYLRPALDIPYGHHEKWDGTGYPQKLSGEQIPLAARIFAIADVWDALVTNRPYRAAWSKEKVLTYIREQSGKHFDPQVVEAFLSMISEIQDV